MGLTTYTVAAALVAGCCGTSFAQTTTNGSGAVGDHWTLAGFVGTNFSFKADDPNADHPSFEIGGAISHMWGGVAGAEVLADFAPQFRMNNAFLASSPNVNTYMANFIAAVPFGP